MLIRDSFSDSAGGMPSDEQEYTLRQLITLFILQYHKIIKTAQEEFSEPSTIIRKDILDDLSFSLLKFDVSKKQNDIILNIDGAGLGE